MTPVQTEDQICARPGCSNLLPAVRRSSRRYCDEKCSRLDYWHKNKDRYDHYRLKNRYGVSQEQYDEMLSRQNGKCAICRQPCKNKGRKRLSVDHDHRTGQVRQLICSNCNTILGMADDDPERLEAAAAYLRRHS